MRKLTSVNSFDDDIAIAETPPAPNLNISGADIMAGMNGGRGIPRAESPDGRSKQIQYWHKCVGCSYHTEELNWVTTGPVMQPRTAIEYTEFQSNKHATPLNKYGAWTIGKVNGQKYDLTNPPTRFNYIIENGGILEFPLDQMIAYNWHRIPVICAVRPELNNVVDIPCEYGCSGRKFVGFENYRNHLNVMHKDAIQPEAIGKQFKDAINMLAERDRMVSGLTPDQLQLVINAVQAQMEAKQVH